MATKTETTVAVEQTKPKSNYITGFCGTGAHEGSSLFTAKGSRLVPCKGVYRVQSGPRLIEVICTCQCHEAFREIREMMAMMNAMHENPATPGGPTIKEPLPPAVVPMPRGADVTGQLEPLLSVAGGLVPPVPTAKERARNFSPTPTGRAARGELEERVRRVVSQYHEIARGMLTPQMIGLYISKEKPPSNGAIYAILDRWQKGGLVELGTKPFRFERFTSLGEIKLLRQ